MPAGYNFGASGADDGNPATVDPLTVCGAGGVAGGTSNLSCRDLSFALWPRLARPDSLVGERETTAGVVSLQWASPSEAVSVYFDGIYSEADHPYERNDLNLAIRSINTNVPVNVVMNDDNVVTSATIANPIWLNENRPYHETTDFINLNSGFEWQIAEKWQLEGSANYNHSDWFRSTNTYLFNTNFVPGTTVALENTGDGVFSITPSRNLNDVNNWNWNALRIQPVQREVYQKGARLALTWGDEKLNVKLGATQDNFHREITTWDLTTCATSGGAVTTLCGAQLAADGIQPATVAVPNAQLANFMQPWTHGALYNTSDFDVGINDGWALPNYQLLDEATNIRYFEQTIGVQSARRNGSFQLDAAKYHRGDLRNLRGSEWQHRGAGQPALQHRRAVHRHRSERRRHRPGSRAEYRHTEPERYDHGPRVPEKRQRLPGVPAELQRGERSQ